MKKKPTVVFRATPSDWEPIGFVLWNDKTGEHLAKGWFDEPVGNGERVQMPTFTLKID